MSKTIVATGSGEVITIEQMPMTLGGPLGSTPGPEWRKDSLGKVTTPEKPTTREEGC